MLRPVVSPDAAGRSAVRSNRPVLPGFWQVPSRSVQTREAIPDGYQVADEIV